MTSTPIVTVLLLAGVHLISAQTFLEYKFIPPAIVHGDGSSSCPSEQQRASSRQKIKESVTSTLGLQPPHQCGARMWTRIAYLNMTDPLQSCPSTWRENTTNGVRVYVEDHQVQMICVIVPFILLEDTSTPRCVVESLAIKLDILMPFTLDRSILPM